MNMLPCIPKAAKYEKQKPVPRRRLKGSDDIFDTKSLNLADVSSWLPCVINLLLRIVDLFWETNFGFAASLSNPQILHKFALFIYLVKQSQSFPHEAFHVATKLTLNSDRKTTGATIGYKVITCSQ